MTDGPFAVDAEAALDALDLAWGDEYDEIWISDGKWKAHHKDAGDDDELTGVTPDELNRLIRADWTQRQNLPPPPKAGDRHQNPQLDPPC